MKYTGDLSHKNFSGAKLSGDEFEKCNLTDVSFVDADLKGAFFNNCEGEGVLFTNAKMQGVRMENCSLPFSNFEHANLSGSKMVSVNLSYSTLTGCRFNGSSIDNLKIVMCEMSMASFMDTQLFSVDYRPTLSHGRMRGIGLFVQGKMRHNQIFINGNNHLAFTDYCRGEAQIERLYTTVEEDRNWIRRPFKVMGLALFGLISKYGQSFARWLGLLIIIVAGFTLLFHWQLGMCWMTSANVSLHAFFSLDLDRITDLTSYLFLLESITGYFMLGVLVSLLTNKIIQN